MSSGGVEKRGSAATVRACDLCRKRKRRCIWTSGTTGCTQCINSNETCTTTHVRKQRARPQRGNRLTEYELRIQSLESLLEERNAAQPQIGQQPLRVTRPSIPASTWVDNLRHQVDSLPCPQAPYEFDPFDLDPIVDVPSFSPTDDLAALSFLNLSQDGSVPTPHGSFPVPLDNLQPSAGMQEDVAFLQNTAFEPEAVVSTYCRLPPIIPTQAGCDLYIPSPEVGTSLLAEFLTDFNAAWPLYQPHVIADHLRVCYAGRSDGSAVSWISAYLVFGIAHIHRAMSAVGTPHDNDMARYYLSRIYQSLNALLVSPPSLGLVQCLVGVAKLIRCTSCNFIMTADHFISTALHVLQSMTYNDDDTHAPEKARDVAQERRVFWIAFIHDTGASIIDNSPTAHRQGEVEKCLDDLVPTDRLGSVTAADGSWRVNIFILRAKLAVLQAEATDQVLSASRNKTPIDLDAATAVVLTRLQAFHNHEIFQLSPSQLFRLLYRSDIVHTISMEVSYFATVFRLHAFMAFDKNPRINPFSLDGLRRMAEVKQQKSYAEAKRVLSLLPIAPRGDVGLYWVVHRVLMAALVTILAHHMHNPTERRPTSVELQEYSQLLADIGILVQNSGNADVARARQLCMDLFLRFQTESRIPRVQGVAERNGSVESVLPMK